METLGCDRAVVDLETMTSQGCGGPAEGAPHRFTIILDRDWQAWLTSYAPCL
jgi:hypothetical protein